MSMCKRSLVNKTWRRKINRGIGFGVKDIVGFQYNSEGITPHRDEEITRLHCQEFYHVPQGFMEPVVPVFTCKFCPMPSYSNIIASADENGIVAVQNIDKFDKAELIDTHKNAVFDLTWAPNDAKFLTLSGDHSVKLWDCGQGTIKLLSVFRGHSKSVKTADFRPNDPAVFATGSRDGTVMVWDSRCLTKTSPDQVIQRATADQCKTNKKAAITSVTAVVYQDDNSLICAGSSDPYIRIWDMRKTYSLNKVCEPKNRLKAKRSGFTDLKLCPGRSKLYASTLKSSIYCFNLNSCSSNPIAEYVGHDAGSFYVKTCVSRDGRYLFSGSSDKLLYVWRTHDAERNDVACRPYITLESHVAEVTGVDMSDVGRTTVVSCADDGTIRKWRPNFTKEYKDQKEDEGISSNLEALNICEEVRQPRPNSYESETATGDSGIRDYSSGCSQESDVQPPEEPIYSADICKTPPKKTMPENPLSSKRKIGETSPYGQLSPQLKRPVLYLSNTPTKEDPSEYLSPTQNLPNYVLDGTGPHHRCSRSQQKENVDWLTQIRRNASKSIERSTERVTSAEKHLGGRSKKSERRNGKRTSRRTLFEYYKKCSKGTDDSAQKNVEQ